MDDLTNSNNQTSDLNRLRLKKVKRPVNRTMPQSPTMPSATGQTQQSAQVPFNRPQGEATPSTGQNPFVQQRPQMPQSPSPTISSEGNEIRPQTAPVNSFHQSRAAAAPEQSASEEIDFNIDNYLDADENLPSLNKVPTDYNGGKNPQFIDEDDLDEAQAYGSDLPPYLTKKILALVAVVIFFMGIVISRLIFAEQKIVQEGLRGVVANPEVPMGRARCGVAEKMQGCVLYLMNPQRQDLNARDFYDLASQLTGRQRFVIETGNMRYSNKKIPPGGIAQLNIPPL